jgi:alpha-galactosidase
MTAPADQAAAASATNAAADVVAIADSALRLELDSSLRLRVSHVRAAESPTALTVWAAPDSLLLADGRRIERFPKLHATREPLEGRYGGGTGVTLTGVAAPGIEKTVRIELYARYPGFAFYQVSWRNVSTQPVVVRGWRVADLELLAADATPAAHAGQEEPPFWCYCGSTHEDRRDWVQPMKAGFSQQNFMGMTASDYGGGTPIVDVWRRDRGLAVGHLEKVPRLVSLPVSRSEHGARLAISGTLERSLAPGERLAPPRSFIATHTGDYFATLDAYRRVMREQGLVSPQSPEAAYEGIWCAWGYERQCTPELIESTLPKVRDLGLRWAVIDDGWQTNVGDWQPDKAKFPRGSEDFKRLVGAIRAQQLKPRLWVAPLAAAPGSDLLHDHVDMLLLDKEGAPQLVSWWNSFYLCPAYPKTVAHAEALVRRFLGEWGFAGLKIDGQHLNGVAPCYNPAHGHARPEESVEKLPELLRAMYATAMKLDSQTVMELCTCGTCYSFFNTPAWNQAPASDPESSWQVRHKGKTLKALVGPSAAFAGDHVELSDGGDDFASTVGIGGIVSTKFTWPRDPKPKDSFLLTPEREALWRKWIALYNERLLPKGNYRGELYDIGFDRPEAHAVEKSGRMYYAFYAKSWQGPVTLRGLTASRYRIRDYFNDRELDEVTTAGGPLQLAFEHFQVLEAIPI